MTITLTREEAQQVLNAIDDEYGDEAEMIRTRLAQPEPEPVAWLSPRNRIYRFVVEAVANGEQTVSPLYTAPQKKEWVGLTDEEIRKIDCIPDDPEWQDIKDFTRAIEAKLKEKNT